MHKSLSLLREYSVNSPASPPKSPLSENILERERRVWGERERVHRIFTLLLLSALALQSAFAGSAGAGSPSAKADSTAPWKIAGELEEACSCRGPCPCWFKAPPSRMTCDGVQVVFITKGKYGKVPLDGLAIADFVQSPEGKSMFESMGGWNFDYLYIDEKATEEQRRALHEVAAHLFMPSAKKREVRYVPIRREKRGAEHIVTVGDAGSFAGHLIEGGDSSAAPKIVNPPLADPTHREFLQGEASYVTYRDAGQGWKHEHSNYMRNSFVVTQKDYEKFEADLAKKMAK